MSGVNKFIGVGNLTREVEVRKTKSGQAVSSFGIACNETYKDKDGNKQESVEFVKITAWGKLGEICEKYLTTGKQVYIEGKLQTREWEDKEGIKRQTTEIVASTMTMLGQAGNNSESSGGDSSNQPEGGDDFEDDDIPF